MLFLIERVKYYRGIQMVETDNYQAIELIKKAYTKYIDEDINEMIKKHDVYVNCIIGALVGSIVSAVLYGFTQNILFIILVCVILIFGLVCGRLRNSISKQIVQKVNANIAKEN